MRKEHDFLGEKLVPDEVYYGVQTMRAMENFQITGAQLDPDFIQSMAVVKKASCLTNLNRTDGSRNRGRHHTRSG